MRVALQNLRQGAQTLRKKLSRQLLHWRMRGRPQADILAAERKLRGVEQYDKLRRADVVFVSFGALFGSFGEALRTHAVGLSQIFGVLTILLGLLMAGAFERVGRLDALQRDVRIHEVPGRGLAAAPLLGFTFALGWTPCIGPTLGTVLGLSASTDGTTAARGALLSVAYCLGLGLPLLVTGLAFTRAMGAFAVVKRHYRAVMVAGGASLVFLGILQVTGVWAAWTSELQTRFGGWDLPL